MTYFIASMRTCKLFITNATTAHIVHMTWYIMAQLMITMTHLGCQKHTWRTFFFPVAVVCDGMIATMCSCAWFVAFKWFCATSDRRILLINLNYVQITSINKL